MQHEHSDEPTGTLITKDGTRITSTYDQIPGDALLNSPNIVILEHAMSLEYAGETEVHWDDQQIITRCGEEIFICEHGDTHFAGDLLVKLPDGTTTPFTGGIKPPLSREAVNKLGEHGRITRALHYASWIHGALEDERTNTLSFEASTRMQVRAHEFAEAEGVHELLGELLSYTTTGALTHK